jgi:hypothetical protein
VARLLLGIGLAWAGPLASQAMRADPAALKAAFLYNFSQFAEWPADAFGTGDQPFVICLLGRDAIGEPMQAVGRLSVRERSVLVLRPTQPAEARRCHLAYADDLREPAAATLLRSLLDAPVLTVAGVGEDRGVPVAIALTQQGDRLRWSVNLDATRRSRIKLSSKLLEMAVSVTDGGQERSPR